MRGFWLAICAVAPLMQVACMEIAQPFDEDTLLSETANSLGCADWSCGKTALTSECEEDKPCKANPVSLCSTTTPTTQSCDDTAEDCDSAVSGQQHPCKATCNDGAEHCSENDGTACSTPSLTTCIDYKTCQEKVMFVSECPKPPKEICNGLDDNCDQVIDEGFSCAAGQFVELGCGESCGRQLFGCSNVCRWESFGECVGSDDCMLSDEEDTAS